MPLAVTLQTTSDNGQPVIEKTPLLFRVFGKVTPSGSYATGGDTLDLSSSSLFSTTASAPGKSLPSAGLPIYVRFWSAKSAASPQTNLFVYNFAPGTTNANGKMQVFTGAAAQTALTELSAGAYPAGVTADVIYFEAAFPVP